MKFLQKRICEKKFTKEDFINLDLQKKAWEQKILSAYRRLRIAKDMDRQVRSVAKDKVNVNRFHTKAGRNRRSILDKTQKNAEYKRQIFINADRRWSGSSFRDMQMFS